MSHDARYCTLATVAVLLLAGMLETPAVAQRGGRGGGGGGQTGLGPGGGSRSGQGLGQANGDRQRIHATTPGSGPLAGCDGTAQQARDQARDLARGARRSQFDASAARRDRDRLHQQVDQMLAGYASYRQGLDAASASRIEERQRDLTASSDRLRQHLGALDGALDVADPDPARVAEAARSVARATRDWQLHLRELGSAAGS